MNYIDLFSGAGGFSLGFDRAGFQNVFSVDIESEFCETYKANFPNHNLITKDICDLKEDEIKDLIKNKTIDVIIGGPPCQGFSMAGNIGRKFIDDPRNSLFKEFARVVSIVKPKFFVMENVARLYTHNKGETRNEITETFEDMGYKVKCKILSSEDYNVAQVRKRIIFIGSIDNNIEIRFPKKLSEKLLTVKEVIHHFPPLNSGETSNIANHNAMSHTNQMLEKMSYIQDGGDRNQIPEKLRPKSGDIRKYIKYKSDAPSVCITGDMRKVFHYSQNRALTVRELASIQSFPDNFIFKGKSISQQQQVGNSVPPNMAEAIALSIKQMADKHKYPKVNYIGNKEKIANWICNHFPDDVYSVFDAFSGGCSLSFEAKKRGYKVISNDILKVNYNLSKALIENKNIKLNDEDVELIFQGKPKKGFMTKNYSNVFFFEDECKELDRYRENIEKLDCEYKKALAYSLMRRAMVRKMPYSRFNINWGKIVQLRDEEYSYQKYKRRRAYHNQSFKEHFLDNLEDYNNAIFNNLQNNQSLNDDIFNLIEKVDADLIYLDPPYTGTMNNYFGFYGLIDSFILSKKVKPFENNFIEKDEVVELFKTLFAKLTKYKYWLLSYNSSSHPSKEEIIEMLSLYSDDVELIERDHVYKITGKENKQKNSEYLFFVENKFYGKETEI
ncbi:DNA (cytosine-5-)-methyltransferase [Aliarcobacter skirrowii]|uniref:DNA (cytosine-5-)-methyltransferase n=1 Tax=Aliarcobacter skirrowii TaxID=28200 RepID=UPI0029AE65ED|nr:DNA (cytosine-5-)-methyltransferase [Aliarcobacter skirrowii]MDX4065010.1 DNA (cytosine-5-)-methyltransferase [Aliarcobacter skirrowii]